MGPLKLGGRRVLAILASKKKAQTSGLGLAKKNLAATYSRGSYTTTTIGKAAFDGRVRDGNGSDHSFMATKSQKFKRAFWKRIPRIFTENYIWNWSHSNSRVEIALPRKEEKQSSRTTD